MGRAYVCVLGVGETDTVFTRTCALAPGENKERTKGTRAAHPPSTPPNPPGRLESRYRLRERGPAWVWLAAARGSAREGPEAAGRRC